MAENREKRITDVDFLDSLNGDESFFVNQNSSIKQINRSNILLGVTFGIENGGTGATTAKDARANLGAVSINTSTVELLVDGWSDNIQTVKASNVTANNIVFVAPEESKDNYETYGKCNIRCSAQADGYLTFECKKVPDIKIVVNIAVFS